MYNRDLLISVESKKRQIDYMLNDLIGEIIINIFRDVKKDAEFYVFDKKLRFKETYSDLLHLFVVFVDETEKEYVYEAQELYTNVHTLDHKVFI